MANLGALSAAAALAQPIETVESKQRELASLSMLKDGIDKERKENMLYQELEAKEYEEISAYASQLLEPDRKKIQAEAFKLQEKVQGHVRDTGSRKMFFSNGGVAALKKYKTDLLNSEPSLRYKDNKNNMERILALQASGKAHLLAPKDLKALQEYQNGEGDKITYSGLMSELDYSIADMYGFGQDVPDIALLRNKDNFTRIYGNYVTENGPDSLKGMDDTQIESTLLSFMNKMGYNTKGKDEFYRQQQAIAARERRAYKEQKAATDGTTEGKQEKILWTNEVNNVMDELLYSKEINADEIRQGDFLTKTESPLVKALIGHKDKAWTQQSRKTATKSGDAFSWVANKIGGKYYRPASAMKVLDAGKQAAEITGLQMNEDGTVNYELSTDYFNGNGEKFEAGDVDDFTISVGGAPLSGKAKVMGAFLGFKTGDGQIIMNSTDSKGKKTANDEEIAKSYQGKSVAHSMFVALQDEIGQTFYKEVDPRNVQNHATLNNVLGANNDLTEVVKSSSATKRATNEQRVVLEDDKKRVQAQIDKAANPDGAFGNTSFINEANKFRTSSGSNRNKMIKAYYMAIDAFTNDNTFDEKRLNGSGFVQDNLFSRGLNVMGDSSLETNMLNFKDYGDTSFIDLYTKTYNDDPDMDDEGIKKNNQFSQVWKNYYNLIR